MNQPQLFDFEGNGVRALNRDEQIWFAAPDVAKALELSNTTVAVSSLDDDERAKFNLGRQGDTNFISEPGLYKLIGASRKPAAKRFNRWVTHDVLPTIRKRGAYMMPETIEKVLLNPDTVIQLATQLKEERSGRLIAEQRVGELQPKADYYDKILANKSLVTITAIAKNYGWSAKHMNQELHQLGVQFNQSGSWFLYSKYQDRGYTHTEMLEVEGSTHLHPQTKWTQKGHLFIYQLLKKHDIYPKIERLDA